MKKRIRCLQSIKLPTEYEIVANYDSIQYFADLIEKAIPAFRFGDKTTNVEYTLKDLNMNIVRPIFGTLPSRNLIAGAYSFDNGEYLIVFESGLFHFCNLLTKVIAQAFPYEKTENGVHQEFDEELVLEKTKNETQITTRFQELVIAYLTTGFDKLPPPYPHDASYIMLAGHLREAMEVFILGHEYAHILLRHVESGKSDKKILSSEDISNVVFSWKQELDADGLGLPLMLLALKLKGRELDNISYSGAEAFFSGYEIIERGKAILKYGSDYLYWKHGKKDGRLSDHPSAETRRKNIRKLMIHNYGPESLKLGILVEKIIKILWERTKPLLLDLYTEKKPLHKKWTL